MLEFMKLYADMEQLFDPYSMEERGRLFTAMMDYAFNGFEPDFVGNERFIWPVLRRHIDQCSAKNETMRENGSKGGRPKTKENQTKPNETKGNQTKPNKSLQEQEHIQEQEQEHIQEQEQEKEDAPAPTGKLLAFDGSDLTADVQRSRDAEMLVAQYLPPSRTPIEYDPRVAEMAALIDKHGIEKVRGALKTAVSSDNRGGISIAFLTAILDEKGAKKSRAAPVDYQARQYSASEVKDMEVDIDALFDEVERSK